MFGYGDLPAGPMRPAGSTTLSGATSDGRDRMLLGPRERVVGDLLPALLRGEQVRTPFVYLHLGERLRLVVRRVRVLHDRRHQVVLTAGDEQQRGPRRVAVVDPGCLRPGLEVCEHAV